MTDRNRSSRRVIVALTFVALAGAIPTLLGRALAQETMAWEVNKGGATAVLSLTVGGSFEAKTAAFAGGLAADPNQPGMLDGTIAVDLRTIDTGIEYRNGHMREKYLEVQRGTGFDHAELSQIKVDGVDPRQGQGKGRFSAVLLLHGVKKPVAGEAVLSRREGTVHVEATFPITISDYGFAKTEYLGVGVKDTVRLKVSLDAVAKAGPGQ